MILVWILPRLIWAGSLRSRCQTGRGLCHRSRLPLGGNILIFSGLETVHKTWCLVLENMLEKVMLELQAELVQVPHVQLVKSSLQQPVELVNTWTLAVIGKGI